jgi:hypothetical protein
VIPLPPWLLIVGAVLFLLAVLGLLLYALVVDIRDGPEN